MKTNCDIIRDLLPLYAEHITSEASNALVEEHLAECEACRAELEQMEQPVPVRPEAQPDAPLRRIRAALQRRSIRAAIGSVLAALCALALIFWMGTARVPATTEQAQFWTYNRKENGADICILEAQGAGQAVADSASLAGNTAAGNADDDIVLALQAQQDQRRTDDQLQGLQTEVVIDITIVDGDLAGAGVNANAGNGILTTTSAVEIRFGFVHVRLPPS